MSRVLPSTRRRFVKISLLAAGAVMAGGNSWAKFAKSGAHDLRVYRLAPLPGLIYSPSFRRLCQRGKFASFESAIAAVRDPKVPFQVMMF